MKKILPILIFTILVHLFTSKTYATFQKHINNPILTSGIEGTWDDSARLLTQVIYDEGIYKMWFVGNDGFKDRIGYATSSDGLIWSFELTNPVLEPTSQLELHYSDPFVLHDDNAYKIWFTVQLSNGTYVIKTSNSPDGINWSTPVVINSTQQWQSTPNMVQPSVIKYNGLYHLWYSSVQASKWKIGYATSSDGINWNKHSTAVLEPTELYEGNSTGGGKVIYRNNQFEIYYHAGNPTVIAYATSTDGINWTKSSSNPLLNTSQNSFDSNLVLSPSALTSQDNSKLLLYYSGYNGQKWAVGLATQDLTPPKPPLKPIVLIPGLFGSWNKEAIIEGKEVSQDKWSPLPFVKVYDDLIKSLVDAGYETEGQDKNLFVFNYDWRKPLLETTEIFKNYLDQNVFSKISDEKIYIIGHSLGGLVGRSYLQTYPNNKIEELISLGSPHSGALPSYKIWEGGVVDSDNFLEKLGIEIVIGLNRKGFKTNKDVVREIVPVIKDILPTFDYLKDKNNSIINVGSLKNQNTYLNSLESGFPGIFDTFYSMYGEVGQTDEWYQVTNPSFIDKLLGLWQDGKPTNTEYSNFGDGTVLAKSATRSADIAYQEPGLNHIELVSTQKGIEEILEAINIQPSNPLNPTSTPPIFPSLFAAIQSPANFTITGPSGSFDSTDTGAVFIPNAISGNYTIQVTGTDTGFYHLIVGEFSNESTNWREIIGDTKANEVDSFTIEYNPNNSSDPLIDPTGMVHFDNAYNQIKNLKDKYPHFSLSIALNSFDKAKQQIAKKNYKDIANLINNITKNLALFRKKFTIADALNPTFDATDDLVISYDRILTNFNPKINSVKVSADISATKGLKEGVFEKLNIKGNEKNAQIYQHASEILDNAESSFNLKNYKKAELEVNIAKMLFLEVE